MTHGGKTPFPSGPLAAVLSPPSHRWQAHHFTSACQQHCCSELCACRQKGPGGGRYGPACAASNELEPVAVVVERRPVVSHDPLNKFEFKVSPYLFHCRFS